MAKYTLRGSDLTAFEKEFRLLEAVAVSTDAVKAITVCFGCGKAEPPGDKFLGCSCKSCQTKGKFAAPFCSKECHAEHWVKHKNWNKAIQLMDREPPPKLSPRETPAEELHTVHVPEGYSARAMVELGQGNYDKAMKHFQKDFKTSPKKESRVPRLYTQMANTFRRHGGRHGEVIQYNLLAAREYAGRVLTEYAYMATLSDPLLQQRTFINIDVCESEWTDRLFEALSMIVTHKFSCPSPPDWLCDDSTLKKVIRVLCDIKQTNSRERWEDHEEDIGRLAEVGFVVAMKLFSKGDWCEINDVPEMSLKDFDDAASFALLSGKDIYRDHAVSLAMDHFVESRINAQDDISNSSSNPSLRLKPGTWVFIKGLQKVGLVCEVGPRNGKLPVQMDGVKDGQYHFILMEHLEKIHLSDTQAAMVACVPKSVQWAFVRPYARAQRYNAKSQRYIGREFIDFLASSNPSHF